MLRTRQFGSYDIIRKLGRGMTDVYLAFDNRVNRHAVLKIVEESPDPLTQLVMQAERRGAKLQQQLNALDPRIIEVYEFGDLDGYFFLSMQYIEGRTVAEILKQEKRIEPARAAGFAAEICGQLDRLHSFTADIDGQKRAVVHGDIKPSNIQIGSNDEVRLLDFGIAKAITFTHSLTHHNLGSPSYCSPERLSRGQVDHNADLWALGVTLYEMVGGSPPYQAQDTRKLENLIQSRRPPRALPDDCPRALKAIIWKALAGDLHQRYVSAAAFESDLKLFLQGQPTVAEKQRRTAWNTNATVEKPRSEPERNTGATIASERPRPMGWRPSQWIAQWKPAWSRAKVAAVLSVLGALFWGLLAGLVIFIPAGVYYRYWRESKPLRANSDYSRKSAAEINTDWDLYRHLQQQDGFLGALSPAAALRPEMKSALLAGADEVIDRYRTSNDPVLQDFEWRKAEMCLQHVIDIDARDRAAQGKSVLVSAYISLLEDHATEGKSKFAQAVNLLPRSPDPHLGLARTYVYAEKNVGKALGELREAQRLGFQLGPREMEEEADGYRFRAQDELNQAAKSKATADRFLQLAQRDFDRARELYEPIIGFSNVSVALRQVDDGDRTRRKLAQPPPAQHPRTARLRTRRWQ